MDTILEAAAELLERTGLEGYSTNNIAARAGTSIGSLYQYFPSKDAVTIALIERESAPLVQEVKTALNTESWHRAIRAMIEAAVRHQLRRPRLARLLDQEENRLSSRRPKSMNASAAFETIVSFLQRYPSRNSQSPEVIANDIMALVRGLTDAAGHRGGADASTLTKLIEGAVFGYLQALAKQPRESPRRS